MKRSLLAHCSLREDLRNDQMTITQERFVVPATIEMLGIRWGLPSDFMSFDHYRRALGNVKFTSSPGYPYMLRFPDNRCFFSAVDGVPSMNRVVDVWHQIQHRLSMRDCDPIYLFVKPEPHKLSKKDRKRVISSVSILDQIIDHMLFDGFNQAIVDNSLEGSAKVGWTPLVGGWKMFPLPGVSIDKKAFDWTVNPWLLECCLKVRANTCTTQGELFDRWLELAKWRYSCLFQQPRFVLPNGEILEQKQPGVMKSGSVLTIVDNCIMQLVLHFRTLTEIHPEEHWDDQVDWFWCLGDDTRQAEPRNLAKYLDKLGEFCIVKEWTRNPEFAGYRFGPGGVMEPLYKGKHAFNLYHASPKIEEDLAVAYSLLYHRSRERDSVRKILGFLGPVPSLEWCDQVVDGE